VFKALAKQQMKLMEKPCLDCADAVHGILFQAVESSLQDKWMETLNSAICRIARKVLHSQLKETKMSIKQHIEIQSEMIFSSDEDFLKLLKVLIVIEFKITGFS